VLVRELIAFIQQANGSALTPARPERMPSGSASCSVCWGRGRPIQIGSVRRFVASGPGLRYIKEGLIRHDRGQLTLLNLVRWARTATSRLVGRGSSEDLAVAQDPIDDRSRVQADLPRNVVKRWLPGVRS
jgi:hypothetical protein